MAGNDIATNSANLSLGFVGHIAPEEGFVSPYTRIALDVLFPSNVLSSKSTDLGMRVSFGCDFYFVRGQQTFLGTNDDSFFIEGSMYVLHGRSDLIAGRPAILSGFVPQVGLRSHF